MFAKIIRLMTILLFLSSTLSATALDRPILPIKKWLTKSGTPVFFVNESELPIVDIQVVFDAGSARDKDHPGIAKITNETLSAGTKTKTADAIAAGFDSIGALYSNTVNRDMAVVALRSLSDPKIFVPALTLFKDILTQPSFPVTEFSRIQKQTLMSLEEQEELPASVATKVFYNTIYSDSPYGHPISGNKASINQLTAEDLRSFYNKFYTAQNSIIAIVGNLDEMKAREIAEDLSKNLNPGMKPSSPLMTKLAEQQPLKKHISFPSSQTNVLMGQVGITRNDPHYFTVVVGNYILGGGALTSRLFDEVREKRGLAYTVRSQFAALKERGPFIIELQTRNSEAGNAIKVVSDTLTQFINSGPSSQELASAKKNLTQGFVLKLASNSAIISQLVNIGYYQLPLNYLDTYVANISKVTDQQVRDVFKNILHFEKMVTVTVGKAMNDGERPKKS
jgi:zinc protease